MITIQGKGVSAGIAMGSLYFYRRKNDTIQKYYVQEPEKEWKRFRIAQEYTLVQLAALTEKARRETGEEAAMLLETHQIMVEDPDFIERIQNLVLDQCLNAEAAVTIAGKEFADMFSAMDDSYMQARSADILDVSRRIVNQLSGVKEDVMEVDEPVILTADNLAPSETIQLDKSKILAFVTSKGSASGHTAILARTMGIPAIIGIGDGLKDDMEGKTAIVNGETGTIFVDPDAETCGNMIQKCEEKERQKTLLELFRGKQTVTRNGRTIRVFCNIGHPADVEAVHINDGEGIGLFRSELLYLDRNDYPTEEEQFQAYRTVLTGMNGKDVIIRTCDIGADKKIDYFHLPKEENPAMGMRAIRICLERTELFRTQLRALFRASAFGKLKIMFPMITSLWEVREAKKICEEVKKELKEEGHLYSDNVEIGIMIETPAAAILSDQLAKEVDFFSCGTNDLTQYTLACDRQNDGLGRFYDPHHPAVLKLLELAAKNAHENGIWIGICGELAGDLELTETFLKMGIDELSVSPGMVLALRKAICESQG